MILDKKQLKELTKKYGKDNLDKILSHFSFGENKYDQDICDMSRIIVSYYGYLDGTNELAMILSDNALVSIFSDINNTWYDYYKEIKDDQNKTNEFNDYIKKQTLNSLKLSGYDDKFITENFDKYYALIHKLYNGSQTTYEAFSKHDKSDIMRMKYTFYVNLEEYIKQQTMSSGSPANG